MRIVWNDTLEIVGEGRFSSSEISREISENIQRQEFLNGTEPQWTSRGNHFNSISVSRWQEFETVAEAELFFLEHGDTEGKPNYETPMVGVVTFYLGDETTGAAIRYANGMLKIRIETPIGVGIRTSYTIEYGRIRKDKPTSS